MRNLFKAGICLTTFYLCLLSSLYAEQNSCVDCHKQSKAFLNKQHQSAQVSCTACHNGNALTSEQELAHKDMIVSPGELSNASQTCGSCHAPHSAGVLASRMHSGSGIVAKTRQIIESDKTFLNKPSFQTLGEGMADSLLRKQCASCHLGQQRVRANMDPVLARGGGCLACHLSQPIKEQHPQLSAKVDDGHCFGCHSRSGRISMNYAGLAETGENDPPPKKETLYRLSDGRLIQKKQADIHHQAGMACIDCHTGAGLMNLNNNGQNSSVDIQCSDCHANRNARRSVQNWPELYLPLFDKVPFETTNNQLFLLTAQGTPLWHIELKGDDALLYPKLGGQPLLIPQIDVDHRPISAQHLKLSCQTCHSNWVPQCLGCHIQYDPKQVQWDHVSRKVTQGRWLEKRWDIGTSAPTLGWLDQDHIDVFIPGMIMTIEHPSSDKIKFFRNFASVAPHTTGKSRQCNDCHISAQMLGLGKGRMSTEQGNLIFAPDAKTATDGIPADAWTGFTSLEKANDFMYPRPFSSEEIRKIYRAVDKSK